MFFGIWCSYVSCEIIILNLEKFRGKFKRVKIIRKMKKVIALVWVEYLLKNIKSGISFVPVTKIRKIIETYFSLHKIWHNDF